MVSDKRMRTLGHNLTLSCKKKSVCTLCKKKKKKKVFKREHYVVVCLCPRPLD